MKGKDWVDMTSAERLDAILLAVHEIAEGRGNGRDAHAAHVAIVVGSSHAMPRPRSGNHGSGNVARQMSMATRVTPGITALRNRGLLTYAQRLDGWSGGCDILTTAGKARVRELLSETTSEERPAGGRDADVHRQT